MNPLLTDLNDRITDMESELEAIKQALDDSGVPTTVHAPDGQGREMTLVERVYLALTRLAPFEGPAYNDLCRDSNDLQRLLNALRCLTWPASDVEGALLWLQALRDCPPAPADLRGKIAQALNCHSAENSSNTPDYVLADFLLGCLAAWDAGVKAREAWHGRPVPARDCSGPFMPAPGRADLYGELACERHGTACPAPEVVDSKPEPTPDGHVCPGCGAAEVEALDTARTVYACGSSDHAQHLNSLLRSTQCLRDAPAVKRKYKDHESKPLAAGTYQVNGIPEVTEVKVCSDGSLRFRRERSDWRYDSAYTIAALREKYPDAIWTKVYDE